jgi:hypothetical protein
VWFPLERSIALLAGLPGGDAVTRAVEAGNATRLFGLELEGASRPRPD